MRDTLSRGMGALICGIALTGCITFYSKTDIERGDEQRRPVRFENERAGTLFTEELERRSDVVGEVAIGMPFVTFYERTRRLSDAAFFNEQVRICDTDQDGIITEIEANVYSRNHDKETCAPRDAKVSAKSSQEIPALLPQPGPDTTSVKPANP